MSVTCPTDGGLRERQAGLSPDTLSGCLASLFPKGKFSGSILFTLKKSLLGHQLQNRPFPHKLIL